jgi:cytochrome c oxidase assembly factor CtaG
LAHAGPNDVPPPLTAMRLLTGWVFEPIPAIGVVVVAAIYLYGVHRLRARGDRWPWWRSVFFVGLGLGIMIVATQSALAAYDTTLLSTHMAQHMLLNMIVPIFLALGAPITLALRTLPRRPRGWLLTVIHSRFAKVMTFPVVAGFIFIANPFVLYFTGYYEATLRNDWLHDFNHVHFVLVGCLWFWPLLGLDPMPSRLPYWGRMIAVFATMPFHAWLGIAIMSQTTVIAESWYAGMARTWGDSMLGDQATAGGILWTTGEVVSMLVFSVLFVQWVHASDREARRIDRQLDLAEARAAAEQARATGTTG